MNTETFPIQITIGHETRNANFILNEGFTRGEIDVRVAAVIGNGAKVHGHNIIALIHENMDAAMKYKGHERFTLEDGRVISWMLHCAIRNRQARIIGFADQYIDTAAATQQNYYGSL